jgi:hypothetical protein
VLLERGEVGGRKNSPMVRSGAVAWKILLLAGWVGSVGASGAQHV